MKKLYTFIALASFAYTATAQDRGTAGSNAVHKANVGLSKKVIPSTNRAPGDTLMYMQLPSTSINSTDAPTFDIVT
jgi:hypothetical protein